MTWQAKMKQLAEGVLNELGATGYEITVIDNYNFEIRNGKEFQKTEVLQDLSAHWVKAAMDAVYLIVNNRMQATKRMILQGEKQEV